MNNDAFLKQYINALDIISGETKATAVGSYEEMLFLYTSKYYEEFTGHILVTGKKLRETKVPASEHAEQFRKISLSLTLESPKLSYIVISRVNEELRCGFVTISLIINPENGYPAGRLIEVEPLKLDFINQMFNMFMDFIYDDKADSIQNSLSKNKNHQLKEKLSEREKQILFLLIMGKPYKQISATLSRLTDSPINPTTVSSIINRQLLKKFNAASVTDLIRKAIRNEVLSSIPTSLLNNVQGIYTTLF